MAKVRLTKNELKSQKDALKRFLRYLPTLILKKQQLQMEIRRVENGIRDRRRRIEELLSDFRRWVAVLGEEVGLEELVGDLRLVLGAGNIAGIDIPLFRELAIAGRAYDIFEKPLWVDRALAEIRALLRIEAEILVLEEQRARLAEELRVTSQRVNLFEKVKIPETRENIRRIQIYLGDQQTAAVVRGKIAKNKLVRVEA
jgi:V/A-type H+-transporting ATPase subunit D